MEALLCTVKYVIVYIVCILCIVAIVSYIVSILVADAFKTSTHLCIWFTNDKVI